MIEEQKAVYAKMRYLSGESVLDAFLNYYGVQMLSQEFIQYLKDELYI